MDTKPAILLLHGYCGGTQEIASLYDALCAAGYTVCMPQLAGHTGKKADIRKSTYRQWLQSAESAFEQLASDHRRVIPIGFSMGALMALYLSTVHEVEAVITINCPVYFLNVPQGIRRFLMDLRCRDFSETCMVFHSMRKTTLHSNIEFLKIHHLMYPVLKRVTVPVYCNQTLDDRTVFGRPSLRYLLKNLPSKAKSYTLYHRGDHQILMGPYKERLISNILTYLKRYE